MRTPKTLEDFADLAGVEIVDCGEGWGGRVGYKTRDNPNATICGFRTPHAARKSWLADTFGAGPAKALARLIDCRAQSTPQPADPSAPTS